MANYANTVHYWAGGSPCWAQYGGAITAAETYNGRLQPLEMQDTSSVVSFSSCAGLGQTGNLLDLGFNFNYGSGDNGNVMGITNNRDTTRSQNFGYDALNRLLTAETTSTYSTSPSHCWGEAYVFDNNTTSAGAWGNLTNINPASSAYNGCTQETLSVTASAQNQSSAGTYDTAGNLTYISGAGGGTFTFNAENQMTQAQTSSTTGYVYDGDGKRAEKTASGTPYKLYWYGVDGSVLDETDQTGSSSNGNFSEYVFFGGQRIGRRDYSNNVYYYASDHLGTSRVIAEVPSGSTTATLCYDADFYPFGGERSYTSNCAQNYKFTGKERDTESNLDNFGARYSLYSIGRFMSPDPMGNYYADGSNPQSWNMYSYAQNGPVTFTDPSGLDCIYLNPSGTGVAYVLTAGMGLGDNPDCTSDSDAGYYVDGHVDQSTIAFYNDGNVMAFQYSPEDAFDLGLSDTNSQMVCVGTCPTDSVTVSGFNPPPGGTLDSMSWAPAKKPFLSLDNITWKGGIRPSDRRNVAAGCALGLDFKTMTGKESSDHPEGSTDVPNGHMGGSRSIQPSSGPDIAPANNSGATDAFSGALGPAANNNNCSAGISQMH